MKQTIEIKRTNGSPSPVVVGDVLGQLSEYLPAGRVIIITDSNIHRRNLELVDSYEHIIIGMGESIKTLQTVENIYRRMLEMNVDRECFILGFGGGIVTDIAGFAASTYMRGLRFGFIASSLLAQVDASVGGKNGVNVDGYKNMVGTFNQPEFVLCDIPTLRTLPEREFRAGVAEMIKAGIIADPELFALLENTPVEALAGNAELLTTAITAAINVKAGIVERDERESDERRKLNLGHTFAHAIEKSTPAFLHGEAVAIGLVMAADLSVRLGAMAESDAGRIRAAVAAAGLPTESGLDVKRVLKAVRLDKKSDPEGVNMVIPTGIGSCEVRKLTFEQLESLVAPQK